MMMMMWEGLEFFDFFYYFYEKGKLLGVKNVFEVEFILVEVNFNWK